MYTLADFGN